jgi:hypothetical protein
VYDADSVRRFAMPNKWKKKRGEYEEKQMHLTNQGTAEGEMKARKKKGRGPSPHAFLTNR